MKAGWEVRPLGEVATIEKAKQSGEAATYVGLEDVSNDTLEFLGNMQPVGGKSSTYAFGPQHFLYGRLRPYLNKALLPNFHGHCSSEIFPILPCKTLDRSFLGYWMTSEAVMKRIDATCTGTRMPRANMKEVMEFPIPIPPLEEQKRIVAVLDAAFEGLTRAKENAEANLQNARELFEGGLAAALDKLETEYGSEQLSDHADFRNGFAFKSARFSDDGEPIVRISNIQAGAVDMTKAVFTKREAYTEDLTRYEVQPDDLLIAMSGATTGKVGFNRTGLTLLQNQRVGRFCPTDTLLLPYLYFVLSTKIEEHLAISAGAAQPNLSTKQIGDILLPVPPIAVQSLFLEVIQSLAEYTDDLDTAYRTRLTDIADLRQSLLQKAFAGELT